MGGSYTQVKSASYISLPRCRPDCYSVNSHNTMVSKNKAVLVVGEASDAELLEEVVES